MNQNHEPLGPSPLGFLGRWFDKLSKIPESKKDPRKRRSGGGLGTKTPRGTRPNDRPYSFNTKTPVERLIAGEWLSHGELRKMQRISAKFAKKQRI